jgi:hypothetical protein
MTTAIAMPRLRLITSSGYQPVSTGSQTVARTWAQSRHYLKSSASDWLPLIEGELDRIRDECGRADWDGQGAVAVADRTIDLAARIAEALFGLLPKGTPAPDLVPESDGEIGMSWTADSTRMFSLSVGEHGKINFAGQFGREGGIHAWKPVDTESAQSLEESLDDVVRYVSRLFRRSAIRRAA